MDTEKTSKNLSRDMFNEEVLIRANTHRQLLNVVKQQKTLYLGHILWGLKYILLKSILIKSREKSRGKEDQIADNTYISATSGIAATSQTLSLYLDI